MEYGFIIKIITVSIFTGFLFLLFYSSYKEVKEKRKVDEIYELQQEEQRLFFEWHDYIQQNDGYDFIKYDIKQKERYRAWCEAKLAVYEFDPVRAKRQSSDLIEFLTECPDEDHQQRILNLLFS